MSLFNIKTQLSILVLASLLAGCAANKGRPAYKDTYNESVSYAQPVDWSPNLDGKTLSSQERQLLNQRTYYFDFDRSELSYTDIESIQAHARYLKNYPSARIRIDGHTDERGTREYNVALAERRAKAVAQELQNLGIPQEQIVIVSYGKEKPAVFGHDEAAWAQNRRALIQYEVS